MIYTFETEPISRLIYVDIKVEEHNFRMMLDTGASSTTFDINAFSAFGHTVRGMKVQMYDFYKHGILSERRQSAIRTY